MLQHFRTYFGNIWYFANVFNQTRYCIYEYDIGMMKIFTFSALLSWPEWDSAVATVWTSNHAGSSLDGVYQEYESINPNVLFLKHLKYVHRDHVQ